MPSTPFAAAHAIALWSDLKRANSEAAKKERLIQYLSLTFAQDPAVQILITEMTLGAERTIANIPRGGKIGRGRTDTQTETVIIEWEKDLTATGDHARKQLEEYLVGNWRSGKEYQFVLLTSDGLRWRRYAPNWADLAKGKAGSKLMSVDLKETSRFDLNELTASEFAFS